jgi:hypothetical protein
MKIGNKDITLGEFYTFEVVGNILSVEAKAEIISYLYRTLNIDFYDYLDYNDFDWSWSTRQGTLPKRIKSILYKRFDYSLKSSELSSLGNFCQERLEKSATYIFDITREFDWYPGDFDDDDSCYFHSKAGARQMIYDNGGYAIRFYNNLNSKKVGCGRTWLIPVLEHKYWVIFNAYGSYALRDYANMLSKWTHLISKEVDLVNNGSPVNMLWINNGKGFILGDKTDKIIGTINKIDFNWREVLTWNCCCVCRQPLIHQLTINHSAKGYGDSLYCRECYKQLHGEKEKTKKEQEDDSLFTNISIN